jgi:hypothetical protein
VLRKTKRLTIYPLGEKLTALPTVLKKVDSDTTECIQFVGHGTSGLFQTRN